MEHFVKYRNWYYLGTSILFVLIAASTSPLYEFNRNPDGQVYMDIGKMLFYGKSPYSELFDHKGPLIFLLYGVGYAINPGNFFGVALIEIIFTYLTLKWGYRLSNFFTKGILCTIIPFYLPLCYLLMSAGHPAEFLIPFQILSLIYFFEYFYSRNILLPSIKLWNLGMIVSFAFWLKFNLCSFWLVPLFFILFRIWKQAGARRLLKSVSHFSGGFMAITMPILIYYGIQGTLNDLYECYFSYNFSYGTEAQPFAWFTWRLFLKGITFGGCSLLMIFSNYTVWKHTKSVPFLIAWIAGILITWIADFMGGRAPYNYFIILLPYAFIGLVGLMELVKEKLQWKLFYSRKLYLLAILCPLAASSYNFYQKFTGKLKENNRGLEKICAHLRSITDPQIIHFMDLSFGFVQQAPVYPKLKFYIIRPTWDKAVKEVCFYLTNQKADFLIVSFPLDAPIMEPYKNIILKNYIPIDELPNFRSASLNHSMHITLYQSKRSKEQSIYRHLAVPTQTTAKQVSSF